MMIKLDFFCSYLFYGQFIKKKQNTTRPFSAGCFLTNEHDAVTQQVCFFFLINIKLNNSDFHTTFTC